MSDPSSHRREMEQVFGACADRYDQVVPFFGSIAGRLAATIRERLGGRPTGLFLDVAGGRGALGRAMADAIGAEPIVVSDVSSAMLSATGGSISATRFRLVQADAELLPFRSGCAGAVGCSTSVRFFGSPGTALREMRRVVCADGVLGVSELGPADAKWIFFADLLRRHAHRLGVPLPAPPGERPRSLPVLVQTAGFAQLDAFEETFTFEFEDELHWWEWVQSQTQGHLVSRLGSGAAELRAAALGVVRGFHPIDLRQTVRFVTALAPDH